MTALKFSLDYFIFFNFRERERGYWLPLIFQSSSSLFPLPAGQPENLSSPMEISILGGSFNPLFHS